MSQSNVGEQVVESLSAPFKKVISTVERLSGTDVSAPASSKPNQMENIPDSNKNKQAWKKAMEFKGPSKHSEPSYEAHGAARRARMARKGYTK